MKSIVSLLLFGSSALSSSVSLQILRRETDAETQASWEASGTCAYYYEKPGKHSILSDTCIKYCDTHGGHGFSECDRSPYKDVTDFSTIDKSTIGKDEAGDLFVPCVCKCEDHDVEELGKEIFQLVADALEKLPNILCAVMLQSFVTILEIGIMAVPGGAEVSAAMRAVQAAKTFAENGLEAADFFGNWIGDVCGVPDWNFDLWTALIQAPDSYGTSIGCKRKGKGDCTKPDPHPDPTDRKLTNLPGSTKNNDPPSKTSANDSPTTPTPVQSKVDPTRSANASPTPSNNNAGSTKASPSPTPSNSVATKSSLSTSSRATSTSSSTLSSSSTVSSSSTGCASGSKSAAACEASTPCTIVTPDTGAEDTILPDDDEIEARSDHRSPRQMLQKRDKKKKTGNPCSANTFYKSFRLESDEYPSYGTLGGDVLAYGWKQQNSYCDYDWMSDTKKKDAKGDSDSEHVLEWQLITEFFAGLQASGGTGFEHPDPLQGNRSTDFCTYWVESWSIEPGQEFSIDNGPNLTPFSHIASAYPSVNNFKEEFVGLQNRINAPAKSNLFKGNTPTIWTEKTMDKLAKDNTGRNKVLERMRYAVGAQNYLTEPKIKDIFKAQKERMGTMFDKLDTQMSTHQRVVTDPLSGTQRKFWPWRKQDLLTKWNTFMDTKWSTAVTRHISVVNKYTNALDDAHCQSPAKKSTADKTFCTNLKKLETAWGKAPAFSKPW